MDALDRTICHQKNTGRTLAEKEVQDLHFVIKVASPLLCPLTV